MKKTKFEKFNPSEVFNDKQMVAMALAEAILDGDKEAFQDILEGFLATKNKAEIAEKTGLSRSSVYNAIKGNPSIGTIMEIIRAS